jgi:hypothetical protein
LITDSGAVPFGGRGDEFNILDQWLDDEKAEARFVLAAPAGRGKSALLVRWINRLLESGRVGSAEARWNLAFVPISMQFGTNLPDVFYGALAARLSEILGHNLEPAPIIAPEAYYRSKCSELLDIAVGKQRPILVVIDGVDEALGARFDARWFSPHCGSRLRLLVSAGLLVGDRNATDWAKRLEWTSRGCVRTHDLRTLDPGNVRDLLRKAGAPVDVLASRPEIVNRLHRLSEEGEPLVLSLYIKDLYERKNLSERPEETARLITEDLNRVIKPGLIGYFEDRMRRQTQAWHQEREKGTVIDEETLKAYLAVLACAYAPLTSEELGELVQRAHEVKPTLQVEGTLYPLRRFIFGSGRQKQETEEVGYILSHPRLGEFIREYLDHSPIQRTRQAFAQWGCDILHQLDHGQLPPARVSPYLLQSLTQHFVDVDAPATEFMSLVEEGWLRAWETFEGGYRGFSRDVERVREIVAQKPAAGQPVCAWQIRCRLVQSSLASVGSSVPPELLVECVKHGVLSLSQALYLLQYQSSFSRLEALTALAPRLPVPSLEQALQDARAIGDTWVRVRAVTALAPWLPAALLEQALQDARTIGDQQVWVRAVTKLTPRLPEAQWTGVLKEALQTAQGIYSASERAGALTDLAPLLPEAQRAGVLEQALQIARAIGDVRKRARVLTGLAPLLPEAQRAGVLEEALQTARAVGDVWTLRDLVPLLPEAQRAGMLQEALQTAQGLNNPSQRAGVLRDLAPLLPEAQRAGMLQEALQTARAVGDVWMLSDLVLLLPETQRARVLEEALQAARADKWPGVESALTALAPRLPAPLLEQALQIARAISNVWKRARVLTGLAPLLPEAQRAGVLEEALQAARAGGNVRTLGDLASLLPEAQRAGLLKEALQTAQGIHDVRAQARVLTGLAPLLPEAQRAGVLEEALQAAWALGDEEAIAMALAARAPLLPEAQRVRVLKDVLQSDQHIYDKRARALAALAPLLPEAQRARVLKQALSAACDINLQGIRSRALIAIMPQLPIPLFKRALQNLLETKGERFWDLVVLAPQLPRAQRAMVLKKALQLARRLHARKRVEVLAYLVPLLPEGQRAHVFKEALQTAQGICDEPNRTLAMSSLSRWLSEAEREAVLKEAVRVAQNFDDAFKRARALTDLAPLLAKGQQADVLEAALHAVRHIADEYDRLHALTVLAPLLPETQRGYAFEGALQAVRMIAYESFSEPKRAIQPSGEALVRTQLLAAVAPLLPASALPEVLQAVGGITDDSVRTHVLSILVPSLSEELQKHVLHSSVLNTFWVNRAALLEVLPYFFPALSKLEGTRTLSEIKRAVCDTAKWFP